MFVFSFVYWHGQYVKFTTVVDRDPKAPFSIAATPRFRKGATNFSVLYHFTLDTYLIVLSFKLEGIEYYFWVICISWPGTEPCFPGKFVIYIYIYIYIYWERERERVCEREREREWERERERNEERQQGRNEIRRKNVSYFGGVSFWQTSQKEFLILINQVFLMNFHFSYLKEKLSFWVLGLPRLGIEPQPPRLLVNTLPSCRLANLHKEHISARSRNLSNNEAVLYLDNMHNYNNRYIDYFEACLV